VLGIFNGFLKSIIFVHIEKIHINKPENQVKILVREVPTGNLQAIQELKVST